MATKYEENVDYMTGDRDGLLNLCKNLRIGHLYAIIPLEKLEVLQQENVAMADYIDDKEVD